MKSALLAVLIALTGCSSLSETKLSMVEDHSGEYRPVVTMKLGSSLFAVIGENTLVLTFGITHW